MDTYKEENNIKENFFYEGIRFLGQMGLTAIGTTVLSLPLMYVGVFGITDAIPNEIEIVKRQPFFIDVNGDGIKDRISYRLKENSGLFETWNKLEQFVEYGTEVNGKTFYFSSPQITES